MHRSSCNKSSPPAMRGALLRESSMQQKRLIYVPRALTALHCSWDRLQGGDVVINETAHGGIIFSSKLPTGEHIVAVCFWRLVKSSPRPDLTATINVMHRLFFVFVANIDRLQNPHYAYRRMNIT